jgi:pimeloyl-ACP methyl ester carboxylesterase
VLTALLAVAIVVVAFVVGAGGYVLGSYAFARRHAQLGFGPALREAARELFWVLLVQPLLPLFYVYGSRMGTLLGGPDAPGRRPVVLVHGYAQNRVSFLRVARTLRRRGFAKLFGFNYPWADAVEDNAARLGRFIEKLCDRENVDRVDLVCHSMGGLVALRYAETADGARRVARCVAIATPFGGVAWKGPIFGRASAGLRGGLGERTSDSPASTRLLSIYSRFDNVVHPHATSSLAKRGGRDLDAGTMGHMAILFDPAVCAAVADFLEEPDPPAVVETSVAEVKAAAAEGPAEAAHAVGAHDVAADIEASATDADAESAAAEHRSPHV